ncbi:MAG TPA: tetratricopeptide repeat protein, partial [Candidatus Polarisedimenticolia bacterium]|nr:tetratricopeptide repeat protein [Candidatus Polarisedimenticolia bacterium]
MKYSVIERSPSGGRAPAHPAGLLLLLLLLVLQGAPVPCAAQGDTRTSPIDQPDAQSPLRDPSKEGSIDVLLKQGTTARRQGKLELAIQLFSLAHRLAPERYDVHLMLADTLRRAGRGGEAALRYDEAIAVDPTRAEAYIGRVLLLWDQFNYTTALTIGTQALERVADDDRA